jgi:type I restriction enzyme S subunit
MKRWPTKLLCELCEFRHGNTPSKAELRNWSGSFPWVSPKDMRAEIISNTQDHLSPEAIANNRAAIAKKNSLLVVVRSGILAHTFPVAIAGRDVAFNQDLKALRVVSSATTPRYLFRFLQASSSQILTHGTKRGATVHSLQSGFLESLPAPMPPLAEQERIVKLLDEGDELRKLRVQADRRAAALIPALFHDMFGDPGTNSKGWPVKPFGDLASNQDGRRKPVKASDRAGRKGEYPYYGASGIIDYVEEYLFDETALLIGEDGANLLARSTPIAFLAHGKYWVNNHAHVVTDNGKADLNYLCAALNLRDLTDYVTGSAQPKLNQANMNRMPIPVPPLPLQKGFSSRVSEIRAMQAEQSASHRRLDDLFKSMLHRAFNGEL